MIGWNESTLSRVETGVSKPSSRLRSALIRALMVNPRWLENGEDPMFMGTEPPASSTAEIAALMEIHQALKAIPEQLLRAIAEVHESLVELRMRSPSIIKPHLLIEHPFGKLDLVAPLPGSDALLHLFRVDFAEALGRRGARAELARLLDVSPQAVSDWATGGSSPSAGNLLQILEWMRRERARTKATADSQQDVPKQNPKDPEK